MKAILEMIVLCGRKLLREKKEFQTKSWSKCGHGLMGTTISACLCDHKRTKSEDAKGKYAY
jgi:hypothetical protein